MFSEDLFLNKTIVVTGGGSGIGKQIAKNLVELSANVIILGRNQDKLKSAQSEICDDANQCEFLICDIREPDQMDQVVEKLKEKDIHGLVNNAGGQFLAPLEDISWNGLDSVMKTNFFGGFYLSQKFYTHFFKSKGGNIINIIADMFNGMPMMGHSGAARAAMDNFTKTAAIEWAGQGVRVNAVAPGYINSSGLENYGEKAKPIIEKLPAFVPMERMGTQEEVSNTVLFLLSEASSYINGTTLRVDGGASLLSGPFEFNKLEK